LTTIKEELKETRQQRDGFKRKYEESLTLQDGRNGELVNMLRQAIERLIFEISITPKIKEILTVVLKMLDYDEGTIQQIFEMKQSKKKTFFNFFK
jgi:hypothetical protein